MVNLSHRFQILHGDKAVRAVSPMMATSNLLYPILNKWYVCNINIFDFDKILFWIKAIVSRCLRRLLELSVGACHISSYILVSKYWSSPLKTCIDNLTMHKRNRTSFRYAVWSQLSGCYGRFMFLEQLFKS